MTDPPGVRSADLRRPPPKAIAWVQRHPVVIDVVVVLLACGPYLAALILRWDDLGWWGAPLLLVTAAALMLRRRRPFAVLVVVALACAFSPLAQPGFAAPMIPFSFALYTVASRRSTSIALLGSLVGVAAGILASIPYSLSGIAPPLVAILDPFSLIALVAGLVVRSRRQEQARVVELVNQRIENAALTERTRIAAEMHDVVAHSLSVVVALANGAASIRRKDPERADGAIAQIADVARDALADMHRTLDMLRSADAGLDENLHRSGDNLPDLEELAAGFRAAGLPVTLERTGPELPEDPGIRLAVHRIVQEALTNTLRHAVRPHGATVTVHRDGERVEVTVQDDGEPSPAHTPGHGLVGIEQRAAAHRGRAVSGPLPDRGWRTSAVLLLPETGVGRG